MREGGNPDSAAEFVILGITRDGQPFRPSDWAERLCGVVDSRLESIEPMAYRFRLNFAKDNELRVRQGRVEERTKLAELQRVGDTA
jgi:hypothetical protein